MPDKRRHVSAAQLHEILTREFTDTAAGLCPRCRVPKPVFRDASSDGPNWRVPPLDECDALCHSILVDVAEKVACEYDMARPRKAA